MKRQPVLFSAFLITALIGLGVASEPCLAGQDTQDPQNKTSAQASSSKPSYPSLLVRTYTLVHIRPEQLLQATRIFIEDASFSENMVTVKIWSHQIPKFEEILRKLDVERKTIQFQAFAIVASRDPNAKSDKAIDNKDLRRVLDELKALWNFKIYEVDGPSFVTVRESSGPNSFELVTNHMLNLTIANAKVVGEEPGKRTIQIEQLKLTGRANFVDHEFIDTRDVTLKEKGYLVAGVSGYGSALSALILVISAEIK